MEPGDRVPPLPQRKNHQISPVAPLGELGLRSRRRLNATSRAAMSHSCYARRMYSVASRELRNQTRSLLDRVAAGEHINITVDGRPVAVLGPIARRTRWMTRESFVRNLVAHQADAELRLELQELAPDTTDDLPL